MKTITIAILILLAAGGAYVLGDYNATQTLNTDIPDKVQPVDPDPDLDLDKLCTPQDCNCAPGTNCINDSVSGGCVCEGPGIPVYDTACDADVRYCPDGTPITCDPTTGKYGECPPSAEPKEETFLCDPEYKTAEYCAEIYQPVCGQVQVECFTAPCDPIQETFANSCFACKNERVISYTEGECR